MTWWNWVRISPFALIPFGQWTTSGLRVPPKWLATCLVHWNGASIAHAQPTGTCGSLVGPPISSMPLDGALQPELHAEQAGDLAERALQPALGARAVVADDVHDQRVVELAGRREAVDQPADLVVGVGHVRGVVLHQPGVDLLRVGRTGRPRRGCCPAAA